MSQHCNTWNVAFHINPRDHDFIILSKHPIKRSLKVRAGTSQMLEEKYLCTAENADINCTLILFFFIKYIYFILYFCGGWEIHCFNTLIFGFSLEYIFQYKKNRCHPYVRTQISKHCRISLKVSNFFHFFPCQQLGNALSFQEKKFDIFETKIFCKLKVEVVVWELCVNSHFLGVG